MRCITDSPGDAQEVEERERRAVRLDAPVFDNGLSGNLTAEAFVGSGLKGLWSGGEPRNRKEPRIGCGAAQANLDLVGG
jgi:hypothetical protein